MARHAILALDQGTTNTKAFLVGLDGNVLAEASRPTSVNHPKPGWAEQSASAIAETAAAAIQDVLTACPTDKVCGIGISNQRETIIAWDAKTSQPLAPAIIWQCCRSSDFCAQLRSAGLEPLVREASGLGLEPMFSSGKLRWLLDNVPQAASAREAGTLRAGTVDSWLLWNLTGGEVHATDATNASRTQLLDIEGVCWSAQLCEIFGVPRVILPEVRPSDSLFGHTQGGFGGLPDGIPIHAMLGDSHAALIGHQIAEPGRVKVTIGTGSSLMCTTASRPHSSHGLTDTIAWKTEEGTVFALEGNILVSGHAAAFSCNLLGIDTPDQLTALALSVSDADGITFIPALAGLGAPHWKERARGTISGLNLGSTPGHVARATFEAIAHQICDVVEAMEADLEIPVVALSADGSAARNDFLLQTLADFCGRPVHRPLHTELSALGAASVAAKALGLEMGIAANKGSSTFIPLMAPIEKVSRRSRWQFEIARASLSA